MQFAKRLSSVEHRSEAFLILLFGLALSGFSLFRIHSGTDFSLESSGHVYFSQATAEGVEIASRTHFYRNTVILGTALLLVFSFLLSFFSKKQAIRFSHYPDLALMAVGLIATVFLGSMGVSIKLTAEFLVTLFLLRIGFIFIDRHVSDDFCLSEFGLNSALTLNLLTGIWFVIGGASLTVNIALWFAVLSVLVPILRFGLTKLLKSAKRVSSLLTTLFVVPWCVFLASEYSFWHFRKFGTTVSSTLVFLLLFVTLAFFVHLLILRKPDSDRKRRLIRNGIAVSLLFLFTLVVYYTPVNSDVNDLFETANSANAAMRVFRFHEVPFVDFISSHMLSEQWYCYLYTAVFGYRTNLELLSYAFLNDFIYLCAAYFFLVRIFRNTWTTLFVVCFLPVLNETIFPPIFFSVLSFLAIVQAFRKPSLVSYLQAILVVAALILWRIDTGVVAVMAGGIVFIVLSLWLKQAISWKKLLWSIALFFAFLLTCFLIALATLGKMKVLERITLFIHYISAEQAHGYAKIPHTDVHQFFVIHVLMPAVAVLLILYILFLLRQIPRERILSSGYLLLSSLFLFLVFLFNAPRGLVRHGFPEGAERFFWSTFIPALALFLVHILRKSQQKYSSVIWFSLVFVSFFCFKYFSWIPEQTPLENGLRTAGIFHMKWWSQEPVILSQRNTRSDSTMQAVSGEIGRQINTILAPDETFFDFSNAPLLYFYLNRRVPGFFCQNLQNTVDDDMQMLLINEIPVAKVPMVIYSAVPSTWYDETDGIHNTVRYYLIAEYIHAHYYYFTTADGRAIWLSNQFKAQYQPSKYQNSPTQLNLNFLPAFAASITAGNPSKYPMKSVVLVHLSGDSITVPAVVRHDKHLWLEVITKSHSEGVRTLQLISSVGDTLSMNFSLKSGQNKYLFRLTNNYIWWLPGELEIRIPGNQEVQSLTFYHDERFEN